MGLLSRDEESLLKDASGLIDKARTAKPEKAGSAWTKAYEQLEKLRPKVKERRRELADRFVSVGNGLDSVDDHNTAMRSWTRALEVYGRHVGAMQALAAAYEGAGNAKEAERYFDQALEANPKSTEALSGKASFLLRRGRSEAAAELFAQLHTAQPEEMKWLIELTQLEPKKAHWWLQRAKAARKLGDLKEAMKLARKAADLDGSDPRPRVYQSLLHEEEGDLDEALKEAEAAVMLEPSHVESNLQRARLLSKLDQADAALEAWNKLTKLAPDEPRAWKEAAALLKGKGKLEEAAVHFDRACQLEPADASLWVEAAKVKHALGRTDEALKALDAAVEGGGGSSAVQRARAQLLLKLDRAEDAYQAAAQAVAEDAGDADSLELMLDALERVEPPRDTEILRVTELLLGKDPGNERAAAQKSRALGAQLKWRQAVQAADAGLGRNPRSAVLLRRKLQAQKALEDHKGVEATAKELFALDPKDFSAGLDRAAALFDMARYGDALEAYNQLLVLEPTHTHAATRRGLCLQRLGRHRDAVEALDRVLDHDKDHVNARRIKAESLAALGNRREAVSEMDVAIGTDPKNVRLWLFKASLHQQGGEAEAARRCLAKALEVDPKNGEALEARAQLLLSRGHAQEAIGDLEALTRSHADHADGWLLLAEALEAVGRLDEARAALARGLEQRPKDPTALRQAAALERRAGNPSAAAGHLEHAVEVEPRDVPLIVELGETYQEGGEGVKALAAFETALRLAPDDREVAGRVKGERLAQGKFTEAERLCLDLLERDADDVDALFDLAVARRGRDNLEGALDALDGVLRRQPDDVHALNDRGVVLSAMGKHKEAVEAFSAALETHPESEHAWVNKGLALRRLGDGREALACFRKATEVAPKEPGNWNLLGLTYASLDMHPKALEAYDRGLELAPGDPLLLNNRGKSLADTGELEAALASFEGAVGASPKDLKALLNLGICLDRMGRPDEAEDALERARQIDRSNLDVLNYLGRVKMSRSDFQGALHLYESLLDQDPKHRPAWVNRGICLDNLDRFEEAVVSYRRALDLDADDHLTWYNLGLAYRALERYEEALPCFERANKIDPEHKPSATKLQEVRDILLEREVERYARRILEFEWTHGKRPTREQAFKVAGVPIQHIDNAMAYIGSEPKLDLFSISREDLLDLEKASALVLRYCITAEQADRGEPPRVTLAQLLHHFPDTNVRRLKRILRYIQEVDRIRIDPKKTVTPELEQSVAKAVEIPPEKRNLREVSVRLGAGILRSKRVLQVLASLEQELELPANDITISSIHDAGWKVRSGPDEFGAPADDAEAASTRRGRTRMREEEPEWQFDMADPSPSHASPQFAREFSRYAGGTAPDAVTQPVQQRPRLYCSACKIRGASHRHDDCGEFLCDTCLERFNQVGRITAGMRLLCPVCERPIRDLGAPAAKWDRL